MAGIRNFFAYVIPSVLALALSGVYTIVGGFSALGDRLCAVYPEHALMLTAAVSSKATKLRRP